MESTPLQHRLGALLLGTGMVGFVVATFGRWASTAPIPGEVPAVSLFFVIIGLVFYFPDLLKDETKATSSMRVVVLMTVSVFLLLTVKSGWSANSLSELKLDQSWAWVLAVALGGKVLQSFSEHWPLLRSKGGGKSQN